MDKFKELEKELHMIGALIEAHRLTKTPFQKDEREFIFQTRRKAREFPFSRAMINRLEDEGREILHRVRKVVML